MKDSDASSTLPGSTVGTVSANGEVIPIGPPSSYMDGLAQLMDFARPISVTHLASDEITRLGFARTGASLRAAFEAVRVRAG